MRPSNQDNVCEFVREIVATRIGEAITLTSRPDRDHRDIQAVEELWESAHHQFAVEHTLIESFTGQLANIAKIERLLVLVKDMLAGRLPGRFALARVFLTKTAKSHPRQAADPCGLKDPEVRVKDAARRFGVSDIFRSLSPASGAHNYCYRRGSGRLDLRLLDALLLEAKNGGVFKGDKQWNPTTEPRGRSGQS
jgi:hypothetical protein